MNIRAYSMLLKLAGFRKAYDSRAGGGRCVEFSRIGEERTIEVQLFEEGGTQGNAFYRRTYVYLSDVFSNARRNAGCDCA